MTRRSSWLVASLVWLAPSTAFAVIASDGPFTLELAPKRGRLCVAVPHGDAGSGCNAEALRQMEDATVKGLPEGASLSFLARIVVDDSEPWEATFGLSTVGPSTELTPADLDTIRALVPPRMGMTSATVTERRLKDTQLVETTGTIANADGSVDRMHLYTLHAAKDTYVITVVGPEAHAAEVASIADDALATADGFHPGTTRSAAATDRVIGKVAKALGAGGIVVVGLIWGLIRLLKASKNPPNPPR